MFPDAASTLFFILFFIVVVVSIVLTIVRVFRSGGRGMWPASPQDQPTVKEREIIREIVKVRCPYCGGLHDEKEDKCPHCGGKAS